ncbi:MAG: hypothetical protein KGL39_24825 [Patescibacteria group bacterium]|nr:hypothetical protein [Patescibacteria group bacterium]
MAQDTVVATTMTASSATWAQLKAGGVRGHLNLLTAANAAKANPTTQATVSATGGGASGGNLAAGAYYCSYTFCDAFGETLAGGESATFTVAAGNIPRVTLPSKPTGVHAMNLYLTPVGGAVGSEVQYATGITATTFDCSYAAKAESCPPPTVNTTGADAHHARIHALLDPANASIQFTKFSQTLSNYLSGYPVSTRDVLAQISNLEGICRAWMTLFAEERTLIVANQGTLGFTANTTLGKTSRTFS